MLKYVNMLNERLEQLKDIDLIDNRSNTELEITAEPKVEEDETAKAASKNLNKKSERKRKRLRNETIIKKRKYGIVPKAFVEKELCYFHFMLYLRLRLRILYHSFINHNII